MKPLIRWTLGNVSDDGMDMLKESISLCKRYYPNADLVVCHNSIPKSRLAGLDVELHEQTHTPDMEYPPRAEMWKMYPARMRPESHELVLDNDLLILRPPQEIKEFFESNKTLMLRGRARAYGRYDHLVPQPHAINSGLYGMPPGFDLATRIMVACANDKVREWTDWCDDQGVIAFALFQHDHIIIEPEVILNYFPEYTFPLPPNLYGVHFQGANRNLRRNWRELIGKKVRTFL